MRTPTKGTPQFTEAAMWLVVVCKGGFTSRAPSCRQKSSLDILLREFALSLPENCNAGPFGLMVF